VAKKTDKPDAADPIEVPPAIAGDAPPQLDPPAEAPEPAGDPPPAQDQPPPEEPPPTPATEEPPPAQTTDDGQLATDKPADNLPNGFRCRPRRPSLAVMATMLAEDLHLELPAARERIELAARAVHERHHVTQPVAVSILGDLPRDARATLLAHGHDEHALVIGMLTDLSDN
jgi:hypothetical protein